MSQVHGIIRRSSSFNTGRIEHLYGDRHAHTDNSKCPFYTACVWLLYRKEPFEVSSLTFCTFCLGEYTTQIVLLKLSAHPCKWGMQILDLADSVKSTGTTTPVAVEISPLSFWQPITLSERLKDVYV